MRTNDDTLTRRQAAELMPAGADRDWLFKFAGDYFYERHGGVIEQRIEDSLASLAHYRAMHREDAQQRPDEPPRGMREVLRLNSQLDRALKWHAALWEEAFVQARRAFINQHEREPGAAGKPAVAPPTVVNAAREAATPMFEPGIIRQAAEAAAAKIAKARELDPKAKPAPLRKEDLVFPDITKAMMAR